MGASQMVAASATNSSNVSSDGVSSTSYSQSTSSRLRSLVGKGSFMASFWLWQLIELLEG